MTDPIGPIGCPIGMSAPEAILRSGMRGGTPVPIPYSHEAFRTVVLSADTFEPINARPGIVLFRFSCEGTPPSQPPWCVDLCWSSAT